MGVGECPVRMGQFGGLGVFLHVGFVWWAGVSSRPGSEEAEKLWFAFVGVVTGRRFFFPLWVGLLVLEGCRRGR